MRELDILNQIKSRTGAGSQEQKIELLKQGLQSETFKLMLRVALDSTIVTHIGVIPVDLSLTTSSHCFGSIVNLLVSHNINNEIRNQANDYVNSFESKEDRILMTQVLTKSLNVGVGIKTINKAAETELISDKSVMLATEEKIGIPIADKWFEDGELVFEEEKFDGNRLTLLYEDKFLDGELTAKDRLSISGKVNSILKGKGTVGMDKDWEFNVFYSGPSSLIFGEGFRVSNVTFLTRGFKELDSECLSNIRSEFGYLDHSFLTNQSLPYLEMRKNMVCLFDGVPNITHIKPVWSLPVENMKKVQELFKQYLEKGCEGLILKSGSHYYEPKRSENWIKFKGLNECDMKVVGWYKGKPHTKREAFGGFVVESEDGIIKVEIGTGFKDKEIEMYSEHPDLYIGQIVSVMYNMRIVNKDGQHSLYLPRFKEFRYDKKEANIESEIRQR